MTIRREGKRPPVISCDECGVVFFTKLTDWKVFSYKERWDEAKSEGWTAKRAAPKSEWQHFCGDCSEQASMAVKSVQNG